MVWASYAQLSPPNVRGQRFDSSGAAVGGEFQINSYTTSGQSLPDVASTPGGGFVVAWHGFGSSGSDSSGGSIQARRFDAGGLPLDPEFQVNDYTTDHQWRPTIASDEQGGFVVAWQSRGSYGTDTDLFSVQARRFDPSGIAQGAQFQVNTYTTSDQVFPSVASGVLGGFVVVWVSRGSYGNDSSGWSIQGRRLEGDGSLLGGEFQVNSYTPDDQYRPLVAGDGLDRFLVTWDSRRSNGTDTHATSIQARRHLAAFFYDGFESGDTTRWSAVQP